VGATIASARCLRALLVLPLLLVLAACGGSKVDPAPATPLPPHWEQPLDLGGSAYKSGLSVAGDGRGGLVAAWLRLGPDPAVEVVAARLRPDGTWEAAQVLDSVSVPLAPQAPVVAVDSRGRGSVAWLISSISDIRVAFRMAAVDLAASSPFAATTTAFSADLRHPSDLRLAVGSDGSAMAGWTFDRHPWGGQGDNVDVSTVQLARRGADGTWSAPASYHLNQWSRQGLISLVGHGQGAYLAEQVTGDDAFVDGEAYGLPVGSFTEALVPGWEPAAQFALANHETAWAADGLGGLEAWLLYYADTKVYPRKGTAASVWTVAEPVALPMDAIHIAVLRSSGGGGWLAGSGGAGLWVAPLAGLVPGTPQRLLGPALVADHLVATQDASGRPTLLWVQSGSGGGSVEGLGFSYWNGSAWSTPELVPATAGISVAGLSVLPGPSGLVALWAENGAMGAHLRSARWH
jgi:hypothetical protein